MDKKLYRSESDRMIAGVCGGIGEYFNFDPTILRLLFVFFVFIGGGGVLAYIICWIVIPTESSVEKSSEQIFQENRQEIKEKVTKSARGWKSEVKSDTKKEDK